jgi:hypothetical protein
MSHIYGGLKLSWKFAYLNHFFIRKVIEHYLQGIFPQRIAQQQGVQFGKRLDWKMKCALSSGRRRGRANGFAQRLPCTSRNKHVRSWVGKVFCLLFREECGDKRPRANEFEGSMAYIKEYGGISVCQLRPQSFLIESPFANPSPIASMENHRLQGSEPPHPRPDIYFQVRAESERWCTCKWIYRVEKHRPWINRHMRTIKLLTT